MKRIIIYIFVGTILFFLFPCFFIRKTEETIKDTKNEFAVNKYDYGKYQEIKLLHSKDNTIENINIDEYLYGVVSAEMPASFEKEALKAQAIVARTYTIYAIMNNKNKHENADLCDESSCCQAWITKEKRLEKWEEMVREEYWSKIVEAVNDTKGKIIEYDNKPICAFFHANSGGYTETAYNVWGGNNYPYLQTVETIGESNYSQYASEVSYTQEEFCLKVKENYSDFQIDFNNEKCIEILECTDGKRVSKIKIGNLELSGVDVRKLCGLKSANFNVKLENGKVVFSVIGYGHGVGMSQTGADSMAKEGAKYDKIIKHYYYNVEIIDL